MFIDLTEPNYVEVEVWSLELRGNILYGTTMRELLSEITLCTGRMLPPPEWSQLVFIEIFSFNLLLFRVLS